MEDTTIFEHHFDCVWSSHALRGQPDMIGVPRNFRRMLRPGRAAAVREDKAGGTMLPFGIGLGQPGLEARLFALPAFAGSGAGQRSRVQSEVKPDCCGHGARADVVRSAEGGKKVV